MFLGLLLSATNRATQGIAECERALALDSNLANAHAFIGSQSIYSVAPMKQKLM